MAYTGCLRVGVGQLGNARHLGIVQRNVGGKCEALHPKYDIDWSPSNVVITFSHLQTVR
jgi:hypothetical protein